jgi:hypothetical protein
LWTARSQGLQQFLCFSWVKLQGLLAIPANPFSPRQTAEFKDRAALHGLAQGDLDTGVRACPVNGGQNVFGCHPFPPYSFAEIENHFQFHLSSASPERADGLPKRGREGDVAPSLTVRREIPNFANIYTPN